MADEKAVMAKKLEEHLSNLDQVEEALKVDPNHEELLKLKADLTELIVLVSKEMLQSKASTTASTIPPSEPKAFPLVSDKKDKDTTSTNSSDLADVNGLLSNPNLPSFFHKKWQSKYPPPGSESKPATSSSATVTAVAANDLSDKEAGNKLKRPPRPPGVPRPRTDLTPEQKRNSGQSPSGIDSEIKPGDVQNSSEVFQQSTSAAVHVDADKTANVDADSDQVMNVDKPVTGEEESKQNNSTKSLKKFTVNVNGASIVAHDSAGNRYTMIDYMNNRDKIQDTTLKNFFKKRLKKLNQQCVNDHLMLQGLEPVKFAQNRGVKARAKAPYYRN